MELEAFNIQFDYMKGSNNILADTLSRLISINPDTPTTPEEPGYEFGYFQRSRLTLMRSMKLL